MDRFCASSMTTMERRPASRCERRCAFSASISVFWLVLDAGSPSSELMVCSSSSAVRAGLKM
jgi:hypothetical protein